MHRLRNVLRDAVNNNKTSSLCPACGSGLEKFHWIPNPRPWCKSDKKVLCNGLLRCKNENCPKSIAKYSNSSEKRKWNRDTAAVLNFQHILQGLRKNQCVPERFQRPKHKKPTDTETTSNEATTSKQLPKRPLSYGSDSESDQPLIKLLRGATIDETTTLPQTSDPAIADAVLMGGSNPWG
ncbi:hypothetical protein H4R24_000383 [Coemansia sp. RSA 988]|nr:hypothetical protein H4R24_000383 [Coemansia sp. RSA 988]